MTTIPITVTIGQNNITVNMTQSSIDVTMVGGGGGLDVGNPGQIPVSDQNSGNFDYTSNFTRDPTTGELYSKSLGNNPAGNVIRLVNSDDLNLLKIKNDGFLQFGGLETNAGVLSIFVVDEYGNVLSPDEVVDGLISNTTLQSYLSDDSNWLDETYTGLLTTEMKSGQYYYNENFYYFVVENGIPIRVPRVKYFVEEVVIPAEDVLDLNSTPYDCIDAPGVNSGLVVDKVVLSKGAGAYGTNDDIQFRFTDGSGDQVVGEATDFLAETGGVIWLLQNTNAKTEIELNEKIVAYAPNGDPIAPGNIAEAELKNTYTNLGGGAIFFKTDGTKIYVGNFSDRTIEEYDLSTAWDMSTATYVGELSIAANVTYITGFYISPDGLNVYVSKGSNILYQFTLSTARQISSGSYTQNETIPLSYPVFSSCFFKPDGTIMYIIDNRGELNQYSLSTARDISTISLTKSQDLSGTAFYPNGFFINNTGTKIYVYSFNAVTGTDYNIYVFDLGTGRDIATQSYNGDNISLEERLGEYASIYIQPNNLYMYVGTKRYDIDKYKYKLLPDITAKIYYQQQNI